MKKEEIENKIKQRDEKYESPSSRAERIWRTLQSVSREPITDWDVICFCAEYIGLASAEHMYLGQVAKNLSRLVYVAHYEMDESQLELDKKMKLLNDFKEETSTKKETPNELRNKIRDLLAKNGKMEK